MRKVKKGKKQKRRELRMYIVRPSELLSPLTTNPSRGRDYAILSDASAIALESRLDGRIVGILPIPEDRLERVAGLLCDPSFVNALQLGFMIGRESLLAVQDPVINKVFKAKHVKRAKRS